MYVCVCLAVTQVEVEAAIEEGAKTREAVTRACRAGGDCGACHGMIETLLEDVAEEGSEPRSCPPAAASGERLVPPSELARTRAA